jgi:hypothetical protein
MAATTHFLVREPPARQLLDEIEARVQSCLGGRVRDLQIVYHEGGLILRGRSHSYYAKQLAQHHAQELSELPIWANEIEVI